MDKWDYRAIAIVPSTHHAFDDGLVALNAAGADGWEAVALFPATTHVLMKRRHIETKGEVKR